MPSEMKLLELPQLYKGSIKEWRPLSTMYGLMFGLNRSSKTSIIIFLQTIFPLGQKNHLMSLQSPKTICGKDLFRWTTVWLRVRESQPKFLNTQENTPLRMSRASLIYGSWSKDFRRSLIGINLFLYPLIYHQSSKVTTKVSQKWISNNK